MKILKKKSTSIALIIVIVVILVAVVLFIFGSGSGKKNKNGYLSLDEALAAQNDVLDNEYDNFILPDSVQEVDVQNLYMIHDDQTEIVMTQQHKEDFLKLMNSFSGKNYDLSQIIHDFDLRIADDDFIGVYTELKSFDITRTSCAIARINNATGNEMIINADNADFDSAYSIGGEDYKISEAVDIADKYIKENILSSLKSDEGFKLSYIQVCETYGEEGIYIKDEEGLDILYDVMAGIEIDESKLPEKTNFYNLIYSLTVDGVPVDNNGGFTPDNTNGFLRGSYFTVTVSKKGEIGAIKLSRYFDSTEKEAIEGKIISLESALEKASEYLAGYKKYEVSQIGMSYCCHTLFGEEDITYRPMWNIVLELKKFGYNGPQLIQICVDAVSGDIYLNDSFSGILGMQKNE